MTPDTHEKHMAYLNHSLEHSRKPFQWLRLTNCVNEAYRKKLFSSKNYRYSSEAQLSQEK